MKVKQAGSIYPRGQTWWIKYYRAGRPFRESSHSTREEDAKTLLRRRQNEIASGTFTGPKAERVRISELAEHLLRDYRINERRSLDALDLRWRLHLKPFFASLRAVDLSSALIARYFD